MDAAEWDDSALIHAFNSAMSKYQEMHGSSKRSKKLQEDVKSKPSPKDQGLAEQEQHKRHDESELRAEESNSQAREAFAAIEDTGQEQQPAPEQPCFYDSAAVDGQNNLPGAEQYHALQRIYYQLQQLELQQQVLRQQMESWSGLAGWDGMQHHANHEHPCQTRGYPSTCLRFPVSPHVYPCYCHYHYPAQSSWTCGARCSCLPACAVHGQPRWCQSSCLPPGCSQGHQHCQAQAQAQYCPAYSNPCQHVSKNCEDAGIGTVDSDLEVGMV